MVEAESHAMKDIEDFKLYYRSVFENVIESVVTEIRNVTDRQNKQAIIVDCPPKPTFTDLFYQLKSFFKNGTIDELYLGFHDWNESQYSGITVSIVGAMFGQLVDRGFAAILSYWFNVSTDRWMTFCFTSILLLCKILIVKVKLCCSGKQKSDVEIRTKQLRDMNFNEQFNMFDTYNVGYRPSPSSSVQNLNISFTSTVSHSVSISKSTHLDMSVFDPTLLDPAKLRRTQNRQSKDDLPVPEIKTNKLTETFAVDKISVDVHQPATPKPEIKTNPKTTPVTKNWFFG
jgi:hypothetical protein